LFQEKRLKKEEENVKRGSIKPAQKADETDDEKDDLEEDIEVTHF
jgi:hypothetical protein